jgi:hypothetical protein
VLKAAQYEAAFGLFGMPARTTAVFVVKAEDVVQPRPHRQQLQRPLNQRQPRHQLRLLSADTTSSGTAVRTGGNEPWCIGSQYHCGGCGVDRLGSVAQKEVSGARVRRGPSSFASIIAPVKIYFSGSISGGRAHEAIYQHVVARLQAQGHTVLSAHVADPIALEAEKDMLPRDVFERDSNWVKECEAMVAEVSTPSLGVGYEYGLAVQLGQPVLCVYRSGLRMSKMITGNPAPNLTVATYSSEAELDGVVDKFLVNLTR